MSETIVCPTCGGTDEVGKDGRRANVNNIAESPCPGCIRGRQPSVEVLERMAEAMLGPYQWEQGGALCETWKSLALAAWLAEHKEDEA